MTDNTLDGTWTTILGDQEADPSENTKIIIAGSEAWNAESPEAIGACSVENGVLTITLQSRDAKGQAWCETMIARLANGPSLSGTMNTSGPDGSEFSDPCVLVRNMSVRAKLRPAWTQVTNFIGARGAG